MLIFRRSRPWLLLAVVAAFPLAAFALLPAVGPLPSSSGVGLWLGVAAGVICLLEWLLWLAKRCRGWYVMRLLPSRRWWLVGHIWLGLLAVPLAIVHSGYRWGGPLTALTLLLFVAVSASGVWGLFVQQWVPRRLLQEVPEETVAAASGTFLDDHVREARRAGDHLAAALSGQAAAVAREFLEGEVVPYLQAGQRSRSPLRERERAREEFARLALQLPDIAQDDVRTLRHCCDVRRQIDEQRRLDGLLHGWLLVHVPLSVAFTAALLLHVALGLKLW